MAAAAAATVGARRGRARGQVILVEAELQRKAAENQMKRQQNELAQSILEKYDADHNGILSPTELKKMLADYSKHRFNEEVQPTEEDLVFLFRLFDKRGGKDGKRDGNIDRSELMSLLRAWGDFMKQKEVVQGLVKTFDKDENNAIDMDELQAQQHDARCSALPTLTLTLGGQDYILTGEDYGFQRLGGCQLCVQAREERTWILGDVFHRKFPVTYDFGSHRIGLPPGSRPWTWLWVIGLLCLAAIPVVVVLGRASRRQWNRRRARQMEQAPSAPTAPRDPACELSQRP